MAASAGTRVGITSCVAAVLGCGAIRSSAPESTSATVALRVISGDTGAPVASATVVVDGRLTLTNSHGVATVIPGREARIVSDSFLPRRTSALSGEVTLWPRAEDYPEAYVRALLYRRAYQTGPPADGGDAELRRVVAPVVAVVPAPALWNDPLARAAHEEAAAAISAATDGRIRFVVLRDAGALPGVRTYVDASLPEGDALTYRDLRGDAIAGGRVAYADAGVARNARFVAHELGHVLGLEHSAVRTDVMYFAIDRSRPATFSANERRTIRLLLQRSPGNRFPDTDPPGAAAAVLDTLAAEARLQSRLPKRPLLKSTMAWLISSTLFITNGP